ncbi:MAG: GNAT family N-acetyltransferase [Firmicutes bacterium]|nr:GNAT family N-acetyltransferase [Bacillota bacterium]
MVKLETTRLVIREYSLYDIDRYFELFSNIQAMYYLDDLRIYEADKAKTSIEEIIKGSLDENRKIYRLAIVEKDSGDYIGESGFIATRDGEGGRIAELGFFILPQYWGKGYAYEATKKVIDFAFKECNLHKLSGGCIKDNSASERVMIKMGMRKEADFLKHIWHDGKWKDNLKYGLLKEDWQKSNL